MISQKLKDRNVIEYIIPPIITAFLLFIIYMVKHIYPFGINTIDYFDMGQQITPFYYHVYDFLHGEKNLFYDPYTALSVNMAMGTSGCSNISPFNLFFLFVRRDALLESLSIFLMLKMMCMSFFMYFYIDKRFNIPFRYKCLFSVGYAFSGYVLTLYMTIQWLDVAALFPLLMYFLGKLLREGKFGGYVITLTLSFVVSYYLSIMILMYIVLMVGIDVVVVFWEKHQGNSEAGNLHLLKLLLATIVSIMMGMFILLPQICQTLISARFNNGTDGGVLSTLFGIISTVKPAYTSRWWTLLGTSFAFAIIICGIIRYRKDKKTVFIAVLASFIMLSELIVESVNLFWHFGSYVEYPIRNGFLINFTLAVIACMFLEKMYADTICENESVSKVKVICVCILTAILTVIGIIGYNMIPEANVRKVFHYTTAAMALMLAIYLIVILMNKGRNMWIATLVIAAEFIVFGYILIGKPAYTTGYTEDTEQNAEFIYICNQLDDELKLNDEENALFKRVKNPDTSLNANYGLVLRRSTLSNWTHLLSPKLQNDSAIMGYTIQYTRLLDAGGTVFSDALIGVNKVISCVPQDEKLYTLIDTVNVESNHVTGERADYYIYECKYQMPFGVISDDIDWQFNDICDVYNDIYSSLGGEGNIAEYLIDGVDDIDGDVSDVTDTDECIELNTELSVSGSKALYYMSNQLDFDDYNTRISVNGNNVLVPSISETGNALYPAHFNNNALYLGCFIDEAASVNIRFNKASIGGELLEYPFEPRIVAIDLDKFNQLINAYQDKVTVRKAYKSGYDFTVDNAEEGKWLVLPISYDKGYSVKVNDKKLDVIPVGGMFMAVPLTAGANDIRLTFMPFGMKPGIILSIVGAILLVIVIMLDKKSEIIDRDYKWLNNLYLIGFCVCMIIMYVIPYVYAAISFVM